MTLGSLIKPAIIVATQVYKHRKAIYAVITAQDRYIKGAFVGTRVSKAAQYGWRSGAAAGGLLGSYIKFPDDQLNDGIPTPPKRTTPSQPDKTRSRQTGKYYSRNRNKYEYNKYRRCPRPFRYRRR